MLGGGGEVVIFSSDKSSLEGGVRKKNPEMIGGGGLGLGLGLGLKGKNRETIITHPLNKLCMLP